MAGNTEPTDGEVIPRQVETFEVGAFGVCALYGVITIVRYNQLAATAVKLYPGWGGYVFLALLSLGGLTGLVSYLMKTIMGMRVELASLTLLVACCLAYIVWTLFSVGWRGLGLLLFMGILIAIPGYFRARRLRKEIDSWEKRIIGK